MLKKSYYFLKLSVVYVFCSAYICGFTEFTPKNYYSMSIAEFMALEIIKSKVDINNPDYELLNAVVFHATNQQRLKLKLKTLKHSTSLEKAAMLHSSNMVKHNFFDHIDKKNKDLKEPDNRIMKSGGKYAATGENIHRITIYNITGKTDYIIEFDKGIPIYYQITPRGQKGNKFEILTYLEAGQKVVESWMKSSGHKANIIDKNFTELGCGSFIKLGSSNGEHMPELYFTQNFGGN